MKTMVDRVAVVTGAGSGIGRALALAFAGEGAHVVLADVEAAALDESTAMVASLGVDTLPMLTDVTVHMLCNNAGVGGGGLIRNQQLVDWKWVIDVSLWGVIHGLHHFLPHLIEAEESHVMSTASVAGLMANPGLGPYNAAKYGVVAIMETLQLEMDQDQTADVGVSVLCPGVVKTNITTAQRNRPDHLRRERPEGWTREMSADARRRNANVAAALENRGMDPAAVAAVVIQAMYDRQFWVLSHPEHLDEVQHRNEQLHALTNPTLLRSFTDGE